MQNIIKREITINASQEKIYNAITDPKEVVKWFPDTIEGEYTVGERPVLGFGEHGKSQIYIVKATPHEYFSYRWVPGANHFQGDVLTAPNTLVEFKISEPTNGACTVVLTETGFADLPADIAQKSFEQNSGGWDFMLDRLVKYTAEK